MLHPIHSMYIYIYAYRVRGVQHKSSFPSRPGIFALLCHRLQCGLPFRNQNQPEGPVSRLDNYSSAICVAIEN